MMTYTDFKGTEERALMNDKIVMTTTSMYACLAREVMLM